MVLSKNRALHPAYVEFKAEIYILGKEEGGRQTPFSNNYRAQFFFRTLDITGSITLPEGTEMVQPGENLTVTVKLVNPTVMEKGLRFVIREHIPPNSQPTNPTHGGTAASRPLN